MNKNQYQVYDFASSARVERPVLKAFSHWMQKFAELFAEHWKNFSATPVETSSLLVDAHDFSTIQSKWTLPSYAVEIRFRDEAASGQSSGMLVIDRLEILTMLMDILGNTGEMADRELTSVEDSLCEMIMEQVAASMVQAWPEQEEISANVGELNQQPNRSRMFATDKKLLSSGVSVMIAGSTVNVQVVLAKDETTKFLGIAPKSESQPKNNSRLSTEKIAEIGVEVSVGLGSAELVMDDLVSISVGDIVVLEQSVEEPVVMFANNEPVFRAWPGRLASKQALKIVSGLN